MVILLIKFNLMKIKRRNKLDELISPSSPNSLSLSSPLTHRLLPLPSHSSLSPLNLALLPSRSLLPFTLPSPLHSPLSPSLSPIPPFTHPSPPFHSLLSSSLLSLADPSFSDNNNSFCYFNSLTLIKFGNGA